MFLVNYEDLAQGTLKLRRGWLGEVTIRDGMYVAELRGMTQKLQMTVGEVYTPDCAADLGDARCGVDLAALEESGTVTVVTSATTCKTSLVQATGWYDGGELTSTGGANAGLTAAVRSWDAAAGILTLFLPALYPIQASDAFTIRPGCDKTFATCRAKFDNATDFRGLSSPPQLPPKDRGPTSTTGVPAGCNVPGQRAVFLSFSPAGLLFGWRLSSPSMP